MPIISWLRSKEILDILTEAIILFLNIAILGCFRFFSDDRSSELRKFNLWGRESVYYPRWIPDRDLSAADDFISAHKTLIGFFG